MRLPGRDKVVVGVEVAALAGVAHGVTQRRWRKAMRMLGKIADQLRLLPVSGAWRHFVASVGTERDEAGVWCRAW